MDNNITVSIVKGCQINDCNNKHFARGYCSKHYRVYVRKTRCKVGDCDSLVDAKGYCQKHYKRWRKYGDPNKTYERISDGICKIKGCGGRYYGAGYCSSHYHKYVRHKPCKIDGCNDKAYVRGYCTTHYQRLLRNGDPLKIHVSMEHDGECTKEGCNEKYHANGLCKRHYDIDYRQSEKGKKIRLFSQQRRRALKRRTPIRDLTRKEWESCLRHFEHKCAYCGERYEGLHQEHVIPISRGGSHTKNNIVPSCNRCNTTKGTRTLHEWYITYEYYDQRREEKILRYLGYKVNKNKIQLQLF